MFTSTVKKRIKHLLRVGGELRYHIRHKNQAIAILKKVEMEKGSISQESRKRCDEYANDVLGSKLYAPWLYVYTAIANEFKEGWIPDNFYGAVIVKKQKGGYGKISSLKPLNKLVFHSNNFPDILSYINGIFFDTCYKPIEKEKVSELLFQATEKVVYKLDNSLQGKGIFFFQRNNFDIDAIAKLGNGLFQSYIEQHDILTEFTRSSIATLRMTTTSSSIGDVSLRSCYLRIGAINDTHVQSASHIRVPVNISDGSFSHVGYTTDWLEIAEYPGSELKFAGRFYPNFDKAVAKVEELHKKVAFVRCIGWDVAIDRLGEPLIMEWNGEHNDIKFSEATQGPCFKDMGWETLRD